MRQAQARRRHVGEEVEAACGVDISLLARARGGGACHGLGGRGGFRRQSAGEEEAACTDLSLLQALAVPQVPQKCAASTYCCLLLPFICYLLLLLHCNYCYVLLEQAAASLGGALASFSSSSSPRAQGAWDTAREGAVDMWSWLTGNICIHE